jgi:hypothetical protein
VIEKIAKMNGKWSKMSHSERERLCYHIMICMYLANKEEMTHPSRKRQRTEKDTPGGTTDEDRTNPPKAVKVCNEQLPSTSRQATEGEGSTSTGTTEDTIELEEFIEPPAEYRFELLNHTIGKERAVREICKQWEIEAPSGQWDLIDHKEKMLVLVIVNKDEKKAVGSFNYARTEIPSNSAAYCIPVGETKGFWIQEPGKSVLGEEKTLQFCLQRKQIFDDMGISMKSVGNRERVEDSLFCSKYINECVSAWKKELLKDEGESVKKCEMYPEMLPPKTITPEILQENLKDTRVIIPSLKETPWRGKLIPENYTHCIVSTKLKDVDMIDEVVELVKEELNGLRRIVMPVNEKSTLEEHILHNIIENWESSWKNTFDFLSKSEIQDNLNSENIGEEKQKDFTALEEENYPIWYEDTIIELAQPHNFGEMVPIPELVITPPKDDHPLAKMIEPICTELMGDMLSTQAGVMTSRLTNLYSRLSGAYSGERMNFKKINKGIAIMPIVANLSQKPENFGKQKLD